MTDRPDVDTDRLIENIRYALTSPVATRGDERAAVNAQDTLEAFLTDLAARARAAETYRADRDEYDGLLGRKMEERDRLARRVTELEADCDRLSAEHAEDCQVHQANPPWRCTCDVARLRGRVTELEAALRWYAERRNYLPPAGRELRDGSDGWVFEQDSFDRQGPGARARAALAGDGGGA